MTEKDKRQSSPPEEQKQIPLAELIETRRKKVLVHLAEGINPYPYRYENIVQISSLSPNVHFDELAKDEEVIRLAGRIMLKRKMGKSIFADIRDASDRLQVYVKLDNVGQKAFDLFSTFDLGDIIGCEGICFTTRMGEPTLKVSSFELLCKSLHPLPDKHSGLVDIETRYRRRYADLIANPQVSRDFVTRSRIIQSFREFLNNNGFLEVETPILQPLYGGAMARPFKTHHNTLDRSMYLRIADELYLKRLIVGGYNKVWELCKDFRNEGMDRLHNPEFSMIELYWAYADYRDMAALFEEMLRFVVHSIHESFKITYDKHEIDFEPPFRWVTMLDSIREAIDVDLSDMSFDEALAVASEHGLDDKDKLINWGKVVEAIWEVKVEPTLIQPTFVADFPVEISPLAKRHRHNDRLTERFELFVAGQEMGNAFSELNDPVDQLKRFLQAIVMPT